MQCKEGKSTFFGLILHKLFEILLSLLSGDMEKIRGNGTTLDMNQVSILNKTSSRIQVFYPG